MSFHSLSLVGYDWSSSDNSGEEEERKDACPPAGPHGDILDTQVRKGTNFLLDSGSDSSDSEIDLAPPPVPQAPPPVSQATPHRQPTVPQAPPSVPRLPPPPGAILSSSSVFSNPFRERHAEQLSVLQTHVPLTHVHRHTRPVCVSYRRDGRCRFGVRCKFAHDSDLQAWEPPNTVPDQNTDNSGEERARSHSGPHHNTHTSLGGPARKRRAGVGDTMIPPKQALKLYQSQSKREGGSPFS